MIKLVLRSLMWLYLLVLLTLWGCIYFDSGNSWWITLFLFSPRWVLGLPWLLLFPLTLVIDYRTARWYLIHLLIIVIPLLGFCVPKLSSARSANDGAQQLRVTTCNVGAGPIRVARLLALLRQEQSEVLLLQECNSQLLEELKRKLDWNFRHDGKLVIASSLALSNVTVIEQRVLDQYNVAITIAADVSLPDGMPTAHQGESTSGAELATELKTKPNLVRVVCVHFPTFRPAFEKARSFDASADDEYRTLADEYRRLAQEASGALRPAETPTLIGGDFNVPAESAFYHDYWSNYQNALSLEGIGLCYTKYTRWHGVRIDHLLAGAQWTIVSAKVGPDLGGDHRPVSAVFDLVQPSHDASLPRP
ncbi:MAG: endonuclease/exonuclease/phosphatase family protein [Planctomycetales bacterium]|nr:endonuclease/exonuclease/phosphatase family protein [Planctomycetales bacterium]